MDKIFEYGFWFWSNKLNGILVILSQYAKYKLDEIEIETIRHNLIGTNNELDRWAHYCFDGSKYRIEMQFAYDDAENSDMIHIKLNSSTDLKEKFEILDLFQSTFKNLDLENN
jgi:hypothetical protein